MSNEYSLVPEYDSDGNETGYYTREPDGVSGMTLSALTEFCGLAPGSTTAISNLLERIKNADPETNDLPESLKHLAGQDLRLETNDSRGTLLVQDDACYAIADYYAFDARNYEGKQIAVKNYRTVGRAGMRVFIWSKTGFIPPVFRREEKPLRGTYWYERVKIALSDTTQPLQAGYFCAYLEMMRFFQELEVHADYVVPDVNPTTSDYIVPDISIARMFNHWLRSDDVDIKRVRLDFLGSDVSVDFRDAAQLKTGFRPAGPHRHEIKSYIHVYPEASHGTKNRIPVNSYPNKYREIFIHYLTKIWIPSACSRYFLERDPDGWRNALENLSMLPESNRLALASTFIGALLPALPPSES